MELKEIPLQSCVWCDVEDAILWSANHLCGECQSYISSCMCEDNEGLCNDCAEKVSGVARKHWCIQDDAFEQRLECANLKESGRHEGCGNCVDEDSLKD